MIYVLLSRYPHNDILRAVDNALHGDIIFVEDIRLYNKVTQLLSEHKPDVLVHVRLLSFSYFPYVGADETDNASLPGQGI